MTKRKGREGIPEQRRVQIIGLVKEYRTLLSWLGGWSVSAACPCDFCKAVRGLTPEEHRFLLVLARLNV